MLKKSKTVSVTSAIALLTLIVTLAFGTAAGAAAGRSAHPTNSASPTAVCDTGHVYFAKTKFVFHAGLAFGVFHRYIYKPFKAGAFKSGSSGRLKAAIKGALAAAFVYHELKLACQDANNSSLLRPLLAPLNLAVGSFSTLEAKLKGGQFTDKTLSDSAGMVDGIGKKSAGLGLSIPDIVSGFSGG